MKLIIYTITLLLIGTCAGQDDNILNRFKPPEGFQRTAAENNSFASYLRHLPLKPDGSGVHYYDGRKKPNSWVAEAGS